MMRLRLSVPLGLQVWVRRCFDWQRMNHRGRLRRCIPQRPWCSGLMTTMRWKGSNPVTVLSEGTCSGDALRSARLLIQEKVVEHLRFRETCERLEEARETNSLVLLIGPSGVGKGVLIRFLIERLNTPVASDPRVLRAVIFRAPSPYSPTFPWKAFWIAWLDTLADPLPDRKVERGARRQRQVVGTVDALMRAAVSATRDRGVDVVIIDEALNLVLKE